MILKNVRGDPNVIAPLRPTISGERDLLLTKEDHGICLENCSNAIIENLYVIRVVEWRFKLIALWKAIKFIFFE